jgi:mannose-6-phosphate isomerase-like protein (cupin superfamily)
MKNKSVFISKAQVDEALTTKAIEGKRLLESLKGIWQEHATPINILEDHNVSNEAEVHRHVGDLWIALEGEVEFVVGGVMVDPWAKKLSDGGIDDREIQAKEIKGGITHILHEGDILWIPAGEPHLHKTDSTAGLYIVKVPAREEYPLKEVAGWKGV